MMFCVSGQNQIECINKLLSILEFKYLHVNFQFMTALDSAILMHRNALNAFYIQIFEFTLNNLNTVWRRAIIYLHTFTY